jgi:hypothetical protein
MSNNRGLFGRLDIQSTRIRKMQNTKKYMIAVALS